MVEFLKASILEEQKDENKSFQLHIYLNTEHSFGYNDEQTNI